VTLTVRRRSTRVERVIYVVRVPFTSVSDKHDDREAEPTADDSYGALAELKPLDGPEWDGEAVAESAYSE